MKKIQFILFFLVVVSCSETNKCHKSDYSIPQGYEEFENCQAHYRVFASTFEPLHNIMIKAMMTAYIDTINNKLNPSTTFLLKHISGKTLEIETDDQLIDFEAYSNFVNSNHQEHNDTIVELNNNFDIKPNGHVFNFSSFEKSFAFIDVTFKKYPSLIVKNRIEGGCVYYDVYGIMSEQMVKIDYPPYNEFKSATSGWMLGYGTNIDYSKKEIIIPSLGQGSCSDYGTLIYDHYVFDVKKDKFIHHKETKKYDLFE